MRSQLNLTMNDDTLCILLALWLGLSLYHHGYDFVGVVSLHVMLWNIIFPTVFTFIASRFDYPFTFFTCWIAWFVRANHVKDEHA